jgi:hypothetical protein
MATKKSNGEGTINRYKNGWERNDNYWKKVLMEN